MSQEKIDHIISGNKVTTDKKGGHGIGLVQVLETLKQNQGELAIDSKIARGTKVTLTFPISKIPGWIAKEIKVKEGDTVVVLDDDRSIHGAWDARFKEHLSKINLKHFLKGNKTVDFIKSFPKKNKLFLLADFELLEQNLTGIDVIEESNIKRAVLVTSHYADMSVCRLAVKKGIKILPKQLASEVPLKVCLDSEIGGKVDVHKNIDVVVVDDNRLLVDSMVQFFTSKNKKVSKYYSPKQFLDNVDKYDKNTVLFIDNDFGSYNMSGVDLAKKLHQYGFKKLYLYSGKDFVKEDVPKYLTIISKSNLEDFYKVVE